MHCRTWLVEPRDPIFLLWSPLIFPCWLTILLIATSAHQRLAFLTSSPRCPWYYQDTILLANKWLWLVQARRSLSSLVPCSLSHMRNYQKWGIARVTLSIRPCCAIYRWAMKKSSHCLRWAVNRRWSSWLGESLMKESWARMMLAWKGRVAAFLGW